MTLERWLSALRTRIATLPDTYELAHPPEPNGVAPSTPVKKKKGLSKEY